MNNLCSYKRIYFPSVFNNYVGGQWILNYNEYGEPEAYYKSKLYINHRGRQCVRPEIVYKII